MVFSTIKIRIMSTTTKGVRNPRGSNMMELLGIEPSRCRELCSAIERTATENPGIPFGDIINKASKEHCRDEWEEKFMFYVFGTHQGAEDILDILAHPGALFGKVSMSAN
jgi:hypothetical protein